jgi:GntR family transcriptional regulator
MAQSRGLQASARTLMQIVRPATLDEAETLGISPAAEIFELKRLRLLNGAPVGLEVTRIPIGLVASIADGNFDDRSLYQALRETGVVPTRADYDLQSVAASDDQAALLDCRPGSPLLLALATTYDERGRPFELSWSVFRGDRYRFRTTLFSSGAPPRGPVKITPATREDGS